MVSLNELITSLCPEGVHYVEIGRQSKVLRGKRLTKDQLSDEGKYPVYHGGLDPLGFYHESNRPGETVMVINIGASAGTVGYSSKEFWSSDGCFCIERIDGINSRFLYYALSAKESYLKTRVRHAGIPTLDASDVERIKIPMPPMEIQNEVVSMLDSFEELSIVLEEELQLRKIQYDYCSMELFDSFSNGMDRVPLKELCDIEKGKTPIQKAVPGEYPMVVTTAERKTCNEYQFDCDAVCIPLVSSRGHGVACLNHVYYQSGRFALGNILCAVTPKDSAIVNPRYLYYYFERTKDFTLVPLMKGGANVSLRIEDIAKVKIPVPDIEKQLEIVSILDTFEEMCTDSFMGLPAEIETRKQQYAHYKTELMKFKEIQG